VGSACKVLLDGCVGRIVEALVDYELGRIILRYAQNDKAGRGCVLGSEMVGRMALLELMNVGSKVGG
jgi:hypothetical protein